MNAEQLLTATAEALRRVKIPGVEPGYIDAFLRRHRAGLLAVIQHQYGRLCRPERLLPGYEVPLARAHQPLETHGQLSVFGRDAGSSPHVYLALKARCLPLDPEKARQYAVHARREDERTWRIQAGADWHAREWDAIRALVEGNLEALRWVERDPDGGAPVELGGNPDGAIELIHEGAQHLAQELLEEQAAETFQFARKSASREKRRTSPMGKKAEGTGRSRSAARGRVERMAEVAGPQDPPELGGIIPNLVARGGLRPSLLKHITPSEHAKARSIPGLLRPDGMTLLQAARAHFGPGRKVVSRGVRPDEQAAGTESVSSFLEDLDWDLSEWDEEDVERLCGCRMAGAPDQRGVHA